MNMPSLTNLLYILGAIFAFIIVCKIIANLIGIAMIVGLTLLAMYLMSNKSL